MKNNENKKGKWKEALLDVLLELLLTAIFLAIGFGIFALFGKDLSEIDFEMAILVGIAVVLAPAIIVSIIVHKIHAKKTTKKEENNQGISPENRDNPENH